MPRPLSVLVIDDPVTIRAMMVRVLEGSGRFAATAVRSVDEAEKTLGAERFDVVTLDVEMPGRGGLEFLDQLVRGYRLPVIMLSASTGAGSSACVRAIEAGAVGCFDKADAVRAAPALCRLVERAARSRPPEPVFPTRQIR